MTATDPPQDPRNVFVPQDDGTIHIRRRAVPGFRMDTHTMSPEEALRQERVEQATEFAARITAAIDAASGWRNAQPHHAADRLHVEAFLRAFERADHALVVFASHPTWWTEARDEAWAGLIRIGSTYGEKP